jgi:branched-chain amino acid transport system permease protein
MSRGLALGLALAALAILALAPLGLQRYGIYILTLWLVTAVAALGVNLIVGYAGQETLAQAAFLGIGAFTTALMTKAGLPFALAFTVFVWLFIRNEEWLTGGVSGIQDVPRPALFGARLKLAQHYYWFVLAVTALLAFTMWWLVRSPWGRAFMALRENPIRAESIGVDVRRYTLLAFAIGSAYGGFAGALYAPLVEFIDPAPFALGPSLLFLLMVVVGGAGSFLGPFIGAAVAVLLPEWLRFAQSYYLLIYALLVIVMMAFCPSGIVGLAKRLYTARRRAAATKTAPEAEALALEEVKP